MNLAPEIYTVEESLGVVEVFDGSGTLVTIFEPTADVVQIVTADLIGPLGPVGPVGPTGSAGPQGPQGPFAPTFEQHFASPALVWRINHNLDAYVVTDLYDLYGVQISGDIEMPDRNNVIVTFDVPVAGTARLKA